jgi:arginyl-tRNA--protein-N-Asp/Glu arginylyltransferase
MSLFNKTSVMLSQASDDLTGRPNCSYCSAKRETVNGIESNLEYFTTSFVTNKLRSDDYEILMRRGFTRCGNYLYCRSVKKSCCEVYAYKVKLDDYQLSRNQK